MFKKNGEKKCTKKKKMFELVREMKEVQLVVGTALCWEGEGSVDVRICGEFSFALFLYESMQPNNL